MEEIFLSQEELEQWEAKEKEKRLRRRRPEKKSGRSVFGLKKIIEEQGKKDKK